MLKNHFSKVKNRLKSFVIRNLPVKYREFLVKLKNYKRKIPDKAFINGSTYNVEKNKFWIQFNDGSWEPDLRAFYAQNILNTKEIIDIGGWIGPSMLTAASLKPLKITVIEANPKVFEILKRNCNRNQLGNIVDVKNICLSDETGKKVTFGAMDSFLPHTAINGIGGNEFDLTTVSFTDFFKEKDLSNVNIIKIDIEGGERFLYEGLKYLSQIKGLRIFLALHPPFWPEKLVTCNQLLSVFEEYNVLTSKGSSISLNKVRDMMLINSKTKFPGKTGQFFDIILKTKK